MTQLTLDISGKETIDVELTRHAVCETEMGVAGYVDAVVASHRVEIVASYDNEYAQDDGHPASYVEHVRVDGRWLPEEEPEVGTKLDFSIPGMHPEDRLTAEDLFCAIAEKLGYDSPACPDEAQQRRVLGGR